MMRRFTRRAQSISQAARDFWRTSPTPRSRPSARLGVDSLEDRTTPAITGTFDAMTGTLTLANDATTNEAITITVDGTNNLVVDAIGPITGVGGFTAPYLADPTKGAILATSVKSIVITTDTTKSLDILAPTNLAGATNLKSVTYTGSDSVLADDVDLSANTNAGVRFAVDTKTVGGAAVMDTFVAGKGTNVLTFSDRATATTTQVTAPGNDLQIAFDFSGVTKNVSVNLQTGSASLGEVYTNQTITFAAAGQAANIQALVGGKGNDLLIGNDTSFNNGLQSGGGAAGNYLIGNEGNDTLIGNGGNDQLNVNQDFNFSLAALQAANVDLTANAATLAFAAYGFGKGAYNPAITVPAGGTVFTANAAANIATADAVAVTTATPTEYADGGAGNDGIFGGNGSTGKFFGGAGNDTYGGNALGNFNYVDLGDGDDVGNASTGDTLLGGAGNDMINVSRFNQALATTKLTVLFGGDGNDQLGGSNGSDEIRGEAGNDTIVGNDGNDTLIGGAGNDAIQGNAGADTIDAGPDTDNLVDGASDVQDVVVIGTFGVDSFDPFQTSRIDNTGGSL